MTSRDHDRRLTDGELVERVRAGDVDAYAALVRRYTPIAHRTAVLLGAGPDADDVVQEAFVQAYRALDRFRPTDRTESPFRPWLLRIVGNLTHNHHRARSRRTARERSVQALALTRPTSVDDPADLAAGEQTQRRLLAAVRGLPDPQRVVVTCRYFLELDEAETAAVLGWPRGTVKSRLSRALTALRDAGLDRSTADTTTTGRTERRDRRG